MKGSILSLLSTNMASTQWPSTRKLVEVCGVMLSGGQSSDIM